MLYEVITDEPNVLAIRVYIKDARTNFNVAAPVLFGGDQAIRTAGQWQHDHICDRKRSPWRAGSSVQRRAFSAASESESGKCAGAGRNNFV